MIGNIIEYVRQYGQYSFFEKPLNDVDSLVLCQFAYLKFDGMVPGVDCNCASITVEELARKETLERLFQDQWLQKESKELFQNMLESRRFHSLKMNCYVNIVEKKQEFQFSAITFILEDGTLYIAFRGTDESIVGWKEDFNMAFLSPIPSQTYSVKYLNFVTGKLNKSFYVGGHSKGGNLAIYSAMNCLPSVQDRILKVYSMDGPGFRAVTLDRCAYDKIASRVVKILPHSSLVGMIFENEMKYQVVESKNIGLLQHDAFSWLIKNGEFVVVKGIYESRKRKNKVMNEWIATLTEDEMRVFVDTLFQIISASTADDFLDLATDWKRSINKMMAAYKELDDETTKMLRETIKSLIEISVKEGPKKASDRIRSFLR